MDSITKKDQDRFWDKVIVQDGCWSWKAKKDIYGYGMMLYDGKNMAAHRISWIIHNGFIPDGMLVCHTCTNNSCTNPSHLFLSTKRRTWQKKRL